MSQSLKKQVGLEVVEDLVVAKIGVLWKIKDGLVLFLFIVFVVVHFNKALSDEEHLLDV